MAEYPYFKFFASDWLGSNARTAMTLDQQAAYINLLCRQWGDKTCSLPDDDEALAKLSEMGEGWLANGSQLVRKCFPKHPELEGRIANPKLLKLRAERDDWGKKSAKGGRKSGQTRKLKSKKTPKGGLRVVEPPYEPNAKQPEPEPEPEPKPEARAKTNARTKAKGSAASAAADPFDTWWKLVHRKVGKEECRRQFAATVKQLCKRWDWTPQQAHEFLCERMTAFAASPKGRAGRHSPYPVRWLRNGRYDDDPAEWQVERDGDTTQGRGSMRDV